MHPYDGFARDIRTPSHIRPPEYYLAEIDPGPAAQYGRQWSLFNASAKFTCDQSTQRETLVETFSDYCCRSAALDTRPYQHKRRLSQHSERLLAMYKRGLPQMRTVPSCNSGCEPWVISTDRR